MSILQILLYMILGAIAWGLVLYLAFYFWWVSLPLLALRGFWSLTRPKRPKPIDGNEGESN